MLFGTHVLECMQCQSFATCVSRVAGRLAVVQGDTVEEPPRDLRAVMVVAMMINAPVLVTSCTLPHSPVFPAAALHQCNSQQQRRCRLGGSRQGRRQGYTQQRSAHGQVFSSGPGELQLQKSAD